MRTLLLALTGLVPLIAFGCRSSATEVSEAPAPKPEAPAALPEIRYYMIADT